MATTSAFFALQPDEDGIDFLESRMRLFFDRGWNQRGRFMEPDLLHLTLRYLGDIDESTLQRIQERAGEISAETPPVEWQIGRCSLFPRVSRARIIAASVKPSDELKQLSKSLEDLAVEVGLAAEERLFKPHITLARLKQQNRRPNLPSRPGTVRQVSTKVGLFRSVGTTAGQEYELISEFKLEGKTAGSAFDELD